MRSLLLTTCVLLTTAVWTGSTALRTETAAVARLRTVSDGTTPPGWVKESRSARGASTMPLAKEKRSIQLLLKRSNLDKLEEKFWQVSDPKHESYGDHLSTEEVRDLISPKRNEAAVAIRSWLKSSGITDVTTSVHHDSITFEATWEQLFQLFPSARQVMTRYTHTATGESAVVADLGGTVSVPSKVAPYVELVSGLAELPNHLDTVPAQQEVRRDVKKQQTVRADESPSSLGYWTPKELWEQYNMTQNMNKPATLPGGPHQNTQAYFQCGEGTNIKILSIANNNATCKIEKFINGNHNGAHSSSFRGESDMDAQLLVGLGQRPTWVYSYHAGTDFCQSWGKFTSDLFSQSGQKDTPRVITISYGIQSYPMWCGSAVPRFSSDMQIFGVQGISVLSGSGDAGSAYVSRFGTNHGHLSPSFPSQVPFITAVGATGFTKKKAGSSGRPFTEHAAQFSGGGFSWNYTMPSYQSDVVANFFALPNVTLPTKGKYNYHVDGVKGRATPDVTACGENIAIWYMDGWQYGGGTSASGPIVGGIVSQLNNVRLASANKTMGFINPFFYQNHDCFYDVTKGDTDENGANPGTGWHATKGWDPTSGLGSPNFECLRQRVLALGDKK